MRKLLLFISILSLIMPYYLLMPSKVEAVDVSYQVNSGTDDGWNSGGGIDTTAATVVVGRSGALQYNVFMRFTGVTIPAGALIDTAYLQLYGNTQTGTHNVRIYGQQSNSASTFSDGADYAARTWCTATTNWTMGSTWLGWNNSPDIKTIVQELVNDYSGLSSASIAFKIDDLDNTANHQFTNYEGGSTSAPKLFITYLTVPTATTQAVSSVIYSGGNHYALLSGNITSSGGSTIDQRGFVYGTASVPTNPGNVLPTASGYTANSTAYSTSTGAYTSNITGMLVGTTYYVRAIAHNISGWAYGDEVSFATVTNPTITNMSATYTTNSTSRLNSLVTFDGNQSCNITFGLALASHAANFAAYTNFYYPTGTYDTNDNPYYNLTSLNATTTYYFNVRIVNSYGTAYGTERTFTTTTGIGTPSNLMAIATSNTASLTWLKGVGSEFTLIRYSSGGYPTTVSSGTAIALTTGSSALASSLTSGVTYYFSAWGKAGTLYSDNYTTTMITTLAMSAAATPTPPTATPNNAWVQTPDDTKVANVPILSTIVTLVSDTYNQPSAMTWYFFWIIIGVALGILTFRFSEGKFFAAFIVEILWYSLGVAVGLIMLWLLVILAIIGAGFSFFGDRR